MILEFTMDSLINYKIAKIMTIWYGIKYHDLKMDNILLSTNNIESTISQDR